MRFNSRKKPVRMHQRQADFAISKNRANPFKPAEPKSYRGLIFGIVGAGSAFGAIGLALFHPAFQIDVLSISGTIRTDYAEVQKTARQVLDTKIWWLIPGQNYFFLNQEAIEEVIQNRFRLQTVEATKEFPHTLKIKLTERAPQLAIIQNNAMIALDPDGNEVAKLGRVQGDGTDTVSVVNEARLIQKTATELFKALPVLILPNTGASSTTASSTLETRPDLITGVLAWNSFLVDNKTPVDYFKVTSGSASIVEGEAGLSSGTKLLINFTANRDSQFLAASTFWKQNLATTSIQYLDLRYPGKVFWK